MVRRGGWRTNRKTGGRFYSYRYNTYNNSKLPKIGGDIIRLPTHPSNCRRKVSQPKKLGASTIFSVLNQTPIISEIHAAYTTADFLWTNRELILNLCNVYDQKGSAGLAKAIGTEVARDCLTDFQVEILWTQLSKIVPAPIQPEVKACFSSVVAKITDAEVDFVSNFLAEQTRR